MKDGEPRDQQIEELLESSMQRFEEWRIGSGAYQTLEVPGYLMDVFVPRRLMELAHDPSRVRSIPTVNTDLDMGFFIVETFDEPVSDPEIFARWQEEHPERNGKVVDLGALVATTPEGVDYEHVRHSRRVENGTISLNDKVLLEYYAYLQRPTLTKPPYRHLVETRNLYDREEMQGKGIGTSFYERLEDVLRRLGFKYLAGQVISKHKGFFAKTRTHYKDLPDEIKNELPSEYATNTLGELMVKVL